MALFNLIFLSSLAVSGIYLLRLKEHGVTICNIAMPAEVIYFLLIGILWGRTFSRSVSLSIAGATGVANVGIAVQLFTGNPLLAMGCLNWVRWRQGNEATSEPKNSI